MHTCIHNQLCVAHHLELVKGVMLDWRTCSYMQTVGLWNLRWSDFGEAAGETWRGIIRTHLYAGTCANVWPGMIHVGNVPTIIPTISHSETRPNAIVFINKAPSESREPFPGSRWCSARLLFSFLSPLVEQKFNRFPLNALIPCRCLESSNLPSVFGEPLSPNQLESPVRGRNTSPSQDSRHPLTPGCLQSN